MPNVTEAQGDDRVKEAWERARDFYLSLPLPEPEVRHNMPSWMQIQRWPIEPQPRFRKRD